jgi:hypothetical protein
MVDKVDVDGCHVDEVDGVRSQFCDILSNIRMFCQPYGLGSSNLDYITESLETDFHR